MLRHSPLIQFFARNIFIILGVMCLVAVGVFYMILQNSQPEVVRGGGLLLYEAGYGVVAADDALPQGTTNAPEPELPVQPADTEIVPDVPQYKVVHVVGAVINPGVFALAAGSRVVDALEAAGGACEYADLVRINLAVLVQDAMQIIVPRLDDDVQEVFVFAEAPAAPAVGGTAPAVGGRVNINTADSAQLQTLPGIGPAIAQNIIDFREANGNFANVDELIRVNRIGPIILERLRELVTVD